MTTTEEQELYLAQQDAEKHWQFLEKWLKMVFTDGYVHGVKHALQGKYSFDNKKKPVSHKSKDMICDRCGTLHDIGNCSSLSKNKSEVRP